MRFSSLLSGALLVALFGLPVLAIRASFQKVEYAFRLTLTINVDGTPKQASSVIHVLHRQPPRWLEHMFNLESRVDGDAVFIDLGPRGNVIETLTFGREGKLDMIGRIVLKAFDVNIFWVDPTTAREHPLPGIGAKAELKGEDIPTLVTFTDIGDPKSARVVRPQEFPTVFGPSVTFQSAGIEITDAPVTRTIDKSLPLMRALRERARGAQVIGPNFTPILYYFSREES